MSIFRNCLFTNFVYHLIFILFRLCDMILNRFMFFVIYKYMKKEDSMGDGKNLKKYLDEKGTNVRKIAKATGISATTLYSIIQKDSNIRFDFALRLANELQIDVNKICSASPFSGTIKKGEIYPTLPDGLNGALDASRVKTYLKNSMYPLMYLFGKNSMPDVDNLLTSFYQLDDEARQEVVETIRLKLQYHRDPERAEQIKQIKGW